MQHKNRCRAGRKNACSDNLVLSGRKHQVRIGQEDQFLRNKEIPYNRHQGDNFSDHEFAKLGARGKGLVPEISNGAHGIVHHSPNILHEIPDAKVKSVPNHPPLVELHIPEVDEHENFAGFHFLAVDHRR